jgi:GntR family transcriptional regulator
MMRIRIDTVSEVPLYRQIADALRVFLVSGTLPAGASLPPVRQLALDLGVHFNTVADAYRLLSAEGWLELKRRRGATVLERTTPEHPSLSGGEEEFRKRLSELVARSQSEGVNPKRLSKILSEAAKEVDCEP